MLRGAMVVVKILDTHHHRSPLVPGGLEIPIQMTVKMEYSSQNKDALFKYESLVEQYYKEPVDGKFDDVTDTVLKDLESDADGRQTMRQKILSNLLILTMRQEQKTWNKLLIVIPSSSSFCALRGCGLRCVRNNTVSRNLYVLIFAFLMQTAEISNVSTRKN